MDPITNPFAPGAGTPPPELAGRDALLSTAHIAIERTRLSLPTKSFLLVGLRGVGKTVLLDRMKVDAETNGIHTLRIEAPEGRSLPALLAPQLRQSLLKLSLNDRAKDKAQRALRALTGFAKALKLKFNDIEVGFDFPAEPGLADNGDLEHDLQDLLAAVGEAAKNAETALAMFVDEMQYVEEEQLAALITALHRIAQQQLPIIMIGAGLPQLRGRMGRAKSYAERLFDFPEVGPLPGPAVDMAIEKPLSENGVGINKDALAEIGRYTHGYPYFVQEWGKHSWDVATDSPITMADVKKATVLAIAAMDESFFRVRFDRLTPLEKRYLRSMAELGPGPHRSGDIAEQLGREVTRLSMTRNNLISKGMVWSPSHGDTAFTVLLFDEFMKRIMPGEDWKTE
jgi:hypothetical protein